MILKDKFLSLCASDIRIKLQQLQQQDPVASSDGAPDNHQYLFFFLSEHSLLLVRNRKTVTEPEPGKLESSGRTPGHLLYRLETDLTFQPLGSTLAPPGMQQLPQGSRACREHTK